jgi:hypothetical protein
MAQREDGWRGVGWFSLEIDDRKRMYRPQRKLRCNQACRIEVFG